MLDGVGNNATSLGGRLGGVAGAMAKIAIPIAAVTAVAGTLGKVISVGFQEAKDASAATEQLAAGIKSTGNAANVTIPGLTALASKIQAYSGQTDDSIMQTQALLLTFTNIKNAGPDKIFDQATAAAANMAAKMGGDASQQAMVLGKALNDPIQGIASLRRVGVQFTDSQEAQIKAMMAAGDVMGAQKIILGELETQFGGAAEAAGKSLPGAIERGRRAFEDLAQTIVEKITPILGPIIESAIGMLSGLTSALSGTGTGAGSVLSGISPMVAGFLSLFTAASPFKILLDAIMPILPQIAAGFMNVAQTIGAQLPGILSVLVPLFAAVSAVISQVISALLPLIPIVLQIVSSVIPPLMQVLQAIIPVVMQVINQAIIPLIQFLGTVLPPIIRALLPIVQAVFNAVAAIITAAMQIVQGIINVVMGIITGDWSRVWNGLGQILSGVWNTMRAIVQGALNVLSAYISTALGFIGQIFGGIWNSIVQTVRSAIVAVQTVVGATVAAISGAWAAAWNAIRAVVAAVWGAIRAVITGAMNAVLGVVNSIMGGIRNVVVGGMGAVVRAAISGAASFLGSIRSGFQAAVGAVSGAIGQVMGVVSSLPGRIMGALAWTGGMLVQVGRNIIAGLARGISGAAGMIFDAVRGAVGNVVNFAKKILGIGSPSKVMDEEVGQWIPPGIGNGITRALPKLRSAMSRVGKAIKEGVKQPSFNVGVTGGGSGSGFMPRAGTGLSDEQLAAIKVAVGGGKGGGPDLDGYTLELNADATKATFRKIASKAASDAVSEANDDLYRGRAR